MQLTERLEQAIKHSVLVAITVSLPVSRNLSRIAGLTFEILHDKLINYLRVIQFKCQLILANSGIS